MMRSCLKCRAFYDDEALKFCLNDGVPLVEISQSDELWEQGSDALRETYSIIRRQTLRQNLKKMLMTAVTTILVTMVISVITLNSWIYLNPPEEETARNKLPPPTPESNPQSTPQLESTLTPSPTAESTTESTPSPTLSPTPEPTIESTPDESDPDSTPSTPDESTPDDSTPDPPIDTSPTVEKTITTTPTLIGSPSPSETIEIKDTPDEKPSVCSNDERKGNENQIANQFGRTWRERFLADRERVLQAKIRELIKECEKNGTPDTCRYFTQETQATLSQNPTFLLALSAKNCQLVTITTFFEWTFTIPQNRTSPKKVRKTFVYQKQAGGWTLTNAF